MWDAAEALDACERMGVPMVFDLHHHRCLDRSGRPAGELLARALATWPAEVPAELHLSSGRTGPTDRAHADGIRDEDWEALVALLPPGADADVMVEAKAKDHAVLDLAERIRCGRLGRPEGLIALPAWPAWAGSPPWSADQPQADATKRARAAGGRALVLGGGGSTGNAWLIGVIAGLFDAGLDVTEADLVIGTSAGSTAAAQIAGAAPTELLAAILAAAPQERPGPGGSDGGRVPVSPAARPHGANEQDHRRRRGCG